VHWPIPGDPFEWFASLSQLLICSVVTLSLFSIYFRVLEVKSSKGFWYLSGASLIWALVGFLQLLKVYGVLSAADPGESPRLYDILRTIGSIVNTAILLGAAVHLDAYDLNGKKPPPPFLHPILRLLTHDVGFWVVVLIAALSILVNFLQPTTAKADSVNPDAITLAVYKIPDAVTSIAIIFLLMYGFFVSFQNRTFPLLAWTALLALGIQIVAQVFDMFQSKNLSFQAWHWQLILSSKIMVCALFIALPFSWLHEAWEDLAGLNVADDKAREADTAAPTTLEPEARKNEPDSDFEPRPEPAAAIELDAPPIGLALSASFEPAPESAEEPQQAMIVGANPEIDGSSRTVPEPGQAPFVKTKTPTLQIPGPSYSVGKKGFTYSLRVDCALNADVTMETQKLKMFLRLLEMISRSYNRSGKNVWIPTESLFGGDDAARSDFCDLWAETKLDPLFDVDEREGARRLRVEHNFIDVDFAALDKHFEALKKKGTWRHKHMWAEIRPKLEKQFPNRRSALGVG
jgi:hypothetical protein